MLSHERTQSVQQELLVVSFEDQLVLEHLHHVLIRSGHSHIVVEEQQQHDKAGNRKASRAQEEHQVLDYRRCLQECNHCLLPHRRQASERATRPAGHYLDDAVDNGHDGGHKGQQQDEHEEGVGSGGTVQNRRRP